MAVGEEAFTAPNFFQEAGNRILIAKRMALRHGALGLSRALQRAMLPLA